MHEIYISIEIPNQVYFANLNGHSVYAVTRNGCYTWEYLVPSSILSLVAHSSAFLSRFVAIQHRMILLLMLNCLVTHKVIFLLKSYSECRPINFFTLSLLWCKLRKLSYVGIQKSCLIIIDRQGLWKNSTTAKSSHWLIASRIKSNRCCCAFQLVPVD